MKLFWHDRPCSVSLMNLTAPLSCVKRTVIRLFGNYRWLAAVTGLAAGVLVGLVIFREIWHLQPNLGDLPTWLLLVIGLVGGVIGLLQFRTFVKDHSEEVERNKKRDELMDSQLAEAERRMRADLRRQAEGVELAWVQRTTKNGIISTGIVTNKSQRPITNITSRVVTKVSETILKVPNECGLSPYGGEEKSDSRDALISIQSDAKFALLRRTLSCGFRFTDVPIDPDRHMFVAWFTDDAGIAWQLDDGGHLVPAQDGDEVTYKH
jgi:uncharacterized membrane-anchored protein YhcB (DUF1043 family)